MADDNLNKSGDKKDDKKDALPPTLKDFQKTRIKLQGSGPRTLLERMKSFRKKDLLFILSGLGVLVAAPLAEHLMVGQQPSGLTQGWDNKNGLPGGFGGGGSPYEPGINGLAPGQAAGGNGDIITPFNARDPASLILSPDAAAQPPVGSSNAPADNGNGQGNGQAPWKNVLAQAGGNAAGAATQSAGLPVAPPALGDGVFTDHGPANSTSASYTPPPISASNVPNRAAGNDSLGQVRGGGVTGASPYSLTGQGNSEGLKSAADQAGAYFNRPTSAAGGLEKAASVNMPSGGSGSSGAGAGGSQADKAGGQDSNKNSKSAGESLAEKAAEQNQQHAINLYWKKLEEQQMAPIKLQEKMQEEIVMTPLKAVMGAIGDILKKQATNAFGGAPTRYSCVIKGKYLKEVPGGPYYGCGNTSSLYCVQGQQVLVRELHDKGEGGKSTETSQIVSDSCTALPNSDYSASRGGNNGDLGAGTGKIAKDIGGTAPQAGQDATSIMRVVNDICKQATDDGNSGGWLHGTSPYKTQAPDIYKAASKVAADIYQLTDAEAPKCGVNADESSQGDTALGEIDAGKKALDLAHTALTVQKQDEITATNQVYQVICGKDSSCLLAKIIADSKGGVAQVKPDVAGWNNGGFQNALNAENGTIVQALSGAKTNLAEAQKQIQNAGSSLQAANSKIKGSTAGSDISTLSSKIAAVSKDPNSEYALYSGSNMTEFANDYTDLSSNLSAAVGQQGSRYKDAANLTGGITVADVPTDASNPVLDVTVKATDISAGVQKSIMASASGGSVDLGGNAAAIQGDVNAVSAPKARASDAQTLGADASNEQKAQSGVMNDETTFTTELNFSNGSEPAAAQAAPLTSQQMQSRLTGGS
ncbi:MAG TPA: hypothetical protein VNK24_02330 [Elusimicrobiota bacterium]|nr:hypothetical protein [Elusimicrobiota bacterium]